MHIDRLQRVRQRYALIGMRGSDRGLSAKAYSNVLFLPRSTDIGMRRL